MHYVQQDGWLVYVLLTKHIKNAVKTEVSKTSLEYKKFTQVLTADMAFSY